MTPFNISQIAALATFSAILALAVLNGARNAALYIFAVFAATGGLLTPGKVLTH